MATRWIANPYKLPVSPKTMVWIRYLDGTFPKIPLRAEGIDWRDKQVSHYRKVEKKI